MRLRSYLNTLVLECYPAGLRLTEGLWKSRKLRSLIHLLLMPFIKP